MKTPVESARILRIIGVGSFFAEKRTDTNNVTNNAPDLSGLEGRSGDSGTDVSPASRAHDDRKPGPDSFDRWNSKQGSRISRKQRCAIWDIFFLQPMGGDLAGVEFMSNEAVITVGNDPLKSVADALDAAVQAAKGGVKDVRVTASGALPALSSFLSGPTYKTCYAVSYGMVFSTVLVARAIPKENAAVHGFIDGARAAIDMVNEMRARSLSGEHPATVLPDHGTDTTP